jgi:hypothetical protein
LIPTTTTLKYRIKKHNNKNTGDDNSQSRFFWIKMMEQKIETFIAIRKMSEYDDDDLYYPLQQTTTIFIFFNYAAFVLLFRASLKISILIGEYRTIILTRGDEDGILAPGISKQEALRTILYAPIIPLLIMILVLLILCIIKREVNNDDIFGDNDPFLEVYSCIIAAWFLGKLSFELPKYLQFYSRYNHNNDSYYSNRKHRNIPQQQQQHNNNSSN